MTSSTDLYESSINCFSNSNMNDLNDPLCKNSEMLCLDTFRHENLSNENQTLIHKPNTTDMMIKTKKNTISVPKHEVKTIPKHPVGLVGPEVSNNFATSDETEQDMLIGPKSSNSPDLPDAPNLPDSPYSPNSTKNFTKMFISKKSPHEHSKKQSTNSHNKMNKSNKTYISIPIIEHAKSVNHIILDNSTNYINDEKSLYYFRLLVTYQKLFLKSYLENKQMQNIYSIAYYFSSCVILVVTVILSSLTESNFQENKSSRSLMVFYLTIFVSIGTAILNFLRIETVIQKYEHCKCQYFDLFQDVSYYLEQYNINSKDIQQFHSLIIEKNKNIQNMQQNISACVKFNKKLFSDS